MGERVKDYTGRMSMLIRHYISLVIIFILQKPLFMLYASLGRQSYGVRDWLLVIWHGLPIDLSVAAYLTLIPLLFIIISVWTQSFPVKGLIKFYDFLAALVISAIFVGDCALYPYWGFKLDASVFFYLKTPKEAMASVSLQTVVIGVASILILTAIIYGILKKALKPYKTPYNKVLMRVPVSLIYLLLLGP
ncbi:MAG: LTA synthase family protein, partial [Bacteroidaceae bacterium]